VGGPGTMIAVVSESEENESARVVMMGVVLCVVV
jgi:hypothetical protein